MNWVSLFLITILFNIIACHHFEKKGSSPAAIKKQSNEKRAAASRRSFPKTRELEAKSFIFKGQNELTNSRFHDSSQLSGPVELTDKEKIFFELVGEKLENLTEINVYQKVVEKYQKNDEIALVAYVNLLLKKYPKSIYCDNALYLQGMLLFSQKKFGESLAAFQKILNFYPQSNKAVSALFAKGVVFKKMNLNKQALQLLAQVINRYPGSPESARAEVEVKLITQ